MTNTKSGVKRIRITSTVKGKLAEYIEREMVLTGQTAGSILANLAFQGMLNNDALRSMAKVAQQAEWDMWALEQKRQEYEEHDEESNSE